MKKFFNKKMLALLLAVITTAGVFTACGNTAECETTNSDSQQTSEYQGNTLINLGYGFEITDVGSYTGMYMEDGSDEIVSGVLMIVVTSTSDKTLQYAKITMPAGETDAVFELSTLPPGESVVLLEQNRMAYDKNLGYDFATAENVAFFQQEPSLMEDTFKLQILDGVINVTNISDKDIDGEIVVYYKNSATDLYYGGITYRSRVTGGLKAGEIRQVVGGHISATGTKPMFVTVA